MTQGEVAGAGQVVEQQHVTEGGGYLCKIETMNPKEHYQQGVHIIERKYGRRILGRG